MKNELECSICDSPMDEDEGIVFNRHGNTNARI